jgi:formate hydrogenlyase subunit 4
MTETLAHLLVLLALPPLLQGVIVKTKALFAGRVGAPLLQPYLDLARLLQKEMVISRTTTLVFLAGPALAFVSALAAGLLLPLGGAAAPVRFAGDLILFAYLLALGRFFTVLAALDTGSAFEGMGAARELTFACLAEPALFLGLLALVHVSGSLELSGLFGARMLAAWSGMAPGMVLLFAGLFVVVLAENCRVPFDDPNTHLELTMIHEVMVLDHSGPALAAILYGAALKLFLFGSLIVRMVLPVLPQPALAGWGLFLAGMLVFAMCVGVVESVMARLRLTHLPNLLIGASLLTGFGLVFAFLHRSAP